VILFLEIKGSSMLNHIVISLREAHLALDNLLSNNAALLSIGSAAALLIRTFEQGGRVYSCGNGGSMCDAMHFAEELTGRYRKDRPGLPAIAINDPAHLTCVGNDWGYDTVFSRYIEAHGRPEDCLVAISTSGTSQNIIRAAQAAKSKHLKLIVLTGRSGSELEKLADVCVCTPAGIFADRVQELHIKVLHIFIELIERHMFPANYSNGG
jgi:D-sedoheptulose 7-phosphate isomerase